MNCIGNQVVLYRGRGYSNSFIPCRGVLRHTRSHHLPSLHDMYSATFKRKPNEGVATAYLNTQVSSPGLSPIQVPSAGSPAEVSTYGPKRCVQGSQTPNGRLGTPCHEPTASQPTPWLALSTASSLLQTPETTCNSWTEDKGD